MVWLLTLILGLPLLQQPVTSLGSNLTQSISHNNLSIQAIGDFPKTLPASRNTSWIEERDDNRFTKDLLLPLLPNLSSNEGSGGSGLQQSLEVMLPSTGLLEMDMLIPDRAEKQDFDMQELGTHPAPPTPLKLTQHIDEDDQDIILANNNSASDQATSTMAVQLTTHIHTHVNNNERLNKDQPLLTTIKPITEANSTVKSPVNMYLVTFNIDIEVNNKEDMEASQDTEFVASTQNLSSTTKPEMLGNNGTFVTQSGSIQGFLDLAVGEERYGTNHPPAATPPLQTVKERREETTSDLPVGSSSTTPSVLQATNRATDYSKNKDDEKPKWFGSLFGLLTEHNLSDVIGTCILGPCVVSTGGNVTQLQWEDLKRTLTFAWELHVYGSAVLFLLVVVAATFGVIGGANMLHPFCEAFTLANILLLLAGLLRFVQLIIDPYGSRNILPRPALTALYNLPVPLLLWAQATLALLALREETSPQRLSVTGGLATLHCTSLMLADLLSKTLSPALPLMLQTLTICWGSPLCLGIFFQSLKQLYSSHRTPLPRWSAPKCLENSVRRVLLLCALLGVLSCALQIYSFLWLYGLLGDWRRFGWGWWLGQLSARLLELAWSFSLLLLGSRVFWRPQGSKTAKRAGKRKPVSRWNRLLDRLPMGPWRRPDRNWAELLPNNWKDHKQSRANVSHSVIQNQATPATSILTVHDNVESIGGGVLYSSSYDHHASPLWTSGVEWQEHECFLSLIEFDLHPPSPVNLHHSIDKALHHAHSLCVGTLFTPSAPSWTQNEGSGGLLCDTVVSPSSPTNKVYSWALDNGLSPNSTQHLGTAIQQTQVSVIESLASLTPETVRKVWERHMAIPRVTVDDDCTSIASEDDVTSF
ncbi:proline-rich transmembrane protein 4-like [Sinocyclocheilus rhinocerous]|uniref:Proline-rich transmembrane protein 4-like n=1 Tax=Sinocyclocheilus rhinocerous TaxID=307959 RepID=A0A673HYI6_9TELE|nr:PREDICTED: proline-rich transmembrane protein 4-like [Sinocyclocheilus rhinocerous]XP_016425475.1 PREDICTED: proline-rich transmembrane protein 4-like [Sinocyclocheilus rhinocerous]